MAIRWRTRINNKALGRNNLDSKMHSNSSNNNSHSNLVLVITIYPTNNNTTAATAINGNISRSNGSNNSSSGAIILRSEIPTTRGHWSMFSSAKLGTTVVALVEQVILTLVSDIGPR